MQNACGVLYCRLWPIWLYHIFPHCLIHCTTFGKKVNESKMRIFYFLCKFFPKHFLILRRIKGDIITNVHRFSCINVRYAAQFLIKFSPQIFEKYFNVKLCHNPTIESQFVPWGRTNRWADRQSDMRQLIITFHNFSKAPKNLNVCKNFNIIYIHIYRTKSHLFITIANCINCFS